MQSFVRDLRVGPGLQQRSPLRLVGGLNERAARAWRDHCGVQHSAAANRPSRVRMAVSILIESERPLAVAAWIGAVCRVLHLAIREKLLSIRVQVLTLQVGPHSVIEVTAGGWPTNVLPVLPVARQPPRQRRRVYSREYRRRLVEP